MNSSKNKKPRRSSQKKCEKHQLIKNASGYRDPEDYDPVLQELDRKYASRIEAFRESTRITEEDLKLIVC